VRKSLVLEALRHRALDARADWVDRTMPDDIDVQRNAGLLDTLGIDVLALAEEHAKTANAAN